MDTNKETVKDNIVLPEESKVTYGHLLDDTCLIISKARQVAFRAINNALTIRNWHIGERIAREELEGAERAEYGRGLVVQLANDLTARYGKGFDVVSLHNYIRFYRFFPSILDAASPKTQKVDAVSQQSPTLDAVSQQLLPWTHYRELIRVENTEARMWYEREALREMWSTRTLHRNIASQYYQRLLQSSDKQAVKQEMYSITKSFQQDKLEFIKNPVIAEFLGWQNNADFTESELEGSIISHLQQFIMEMGKGFAFVARQQHIRTDMGDYYIDLVFYNYILKCFFLIDLKTTQISHQDVGQMDMYVRMFDELKRSNGDNPTVGLLLCSDTSEDMARYSVLNGSEQIFQAKYLTYLPTKEELAREIEQQKAIFALQQGEGSDR